MVENLKLTGVTAKRNCDTVHGDFLSLDDEDPRLTKCTMALVDPSCSGGGDFSHAVSDLIAVASCEMMILTFRNSLKFLFPFE